MKARKAEAMPPKVCEHAGSLDVLQGSYHPPPYAHATREHVFRHGNPHGTTYHCMTCRQCPVCKGKLMEVKKSDDRPIYYHLRDCSHTRTLYVEKDETADDARR